MFEGILREHGRRSIYAYMLRLQSSRSQDGVSNYSKNLRQIVIKTFQYGAWVMASKKGTHSLKPKIKSVGTDLSISHENIFSLF